MAHFAQLNSKNIVERVLTVNDNDAPTESEGIVFLQSLYGSNEDWKQTSYNTYGGEHKLDGTPLRKNFAGVGYTYDRDRDAFYESKPYPSWILNEETCLWEAPVAYPEDGNDYDWNETDQQWDLINV
jgi:hypothetical protein